MDIAVNSMKVLLVLSLIFLTQFSILVHIKYMIGYISSKSNNDFRGFIVTTFTNIFTAMILAVIVLSSPGILKQLNVDFILILESGFIFLFLVAVKVRIGINIYRRAKNPANYHINYFGKRIYEQAVVEKKEMAFYFLSMPFTLLCGAYFIVKMAR
jgi:hypothetical protein